MKCQRLAAVSNTCAPLFLGMFMWLRMFRVFFLNLFESRPLPRSAVFSSFVSVDKVGLNGLQSAVTEVLESDCSSCGAAPRPETFTSLLETHVYYGFSLNIRALFLLSTSFSASLFICFIGIKGFGQPRLFFKAPHK